MIIPYDQLSEEALNNLVQTFVGREGTDYGEKEFTLEEKVTQVKQHLMAGLAVILYDDETEDFTIVFKDQLPHEVKT